MALDFINNEPFQGGAVSPQIMVDSALAEFKAAKNAGDNDRALTALNDLEAIYTGLGYDNALAELEVLKRGLKTQQAPLQSEEQRLFAKLGAEWSAYYGLNKKDWPENLKNAYAKLFSAIGTNAFDTVLSDNLNLLRLRADTAPALHAALAIVDNTSKRNISDKIVAALSDGKLGDATWQNVLHILDEPQAFFIPLFAAGRAARLVESAVRYFGLTSGLSAEAVAAWSFAAGLPSEAATFAGTGRILAGASAEPMLIEWLKSIPFFGLLRGAAAYSILAKQLLPKTQAGIALAEVNAHFASVGGLMFAPDVLDLIGIEESPDATLLDKFVNALAVHVAAAASYGLVNLNGVRGFANAETSRKGFFAKIVDFLSPKPAATAAGIPHTFSFADNDLPDGAPRGATSPRAEVSAGERLFSNEPVSLPKELTEGVKVVNRHVYLNNEAVKANWQHELGKVLRAGFSSALIRMPTQRLDRRSVLVAASMAKEFFKGKMIVAVLPEKHIHTNIVSGFRSSLQSMKIGVLDDTRKTIKQDCNFILVSNDFFSKSGNQAMIRKLSASVGLTVTDIDFLPNISEVLTKLGYLDRSGSYKNRKGKFLLGISSDLPAQDVTAFASAAHITSFDLRWLRDAGILPDIEWIQASYPNGLAMLPKRQKIDGKVYYSCTTPPKPQVETVLDVYEKNLLGNAKRTAIITGDTTWARAYETAFNKKYGDGFAKVIHLKTLKKEIKALTSRDCPTKVLIFISDRESYDHITGIDGVILDHQLALPTELEQKIWYLADNAGELTTKTAKFIELVGVNDPVYPVASLNDLLWPVPPSQKQLPPPAELPEISTKVLPQEKTAVEAQAKVEAPARVPQLTLGEYLTAQVKDLIAKGHDRALLREVGGSLDDRLQSVLELFDRTRELFQKKQTLIIVDHSVGMSNVVRFINQHRSELLVDKMGQDNRTPKTFYDIVIVDDVYVSTKKGLATLNPKSFGLVFMLNAGLAATNNGIKILRQLEFLSEDGVVIKARGKFLLGASASPDVQGVVFKAAPHVESFDLAWRFSQGDKLHDVGAVEVEYPENMSFERDVSTGSFVTAQLQARSQVLVDAYKKYFGDKRVLIYAASLKEAKQHVKTFNENYNEGEAFAFFLPAGKYKENDFVEMFEAGVGPKVLVMVGGSTPEITITGVDGVINDYMTSSVNIASRRAQTVISAGKDEARRQLLYVDMVLPSSSPEKNVTLADVLWLKSRAAIGEIFEPAKMLAEQLAASMLVNATAGTDRSPSKKAQKVDLPTKPQAGGATPSKKESISTKVARTVYGPNTVKLIAEVREAVVELAGALPFEDFFKSIPDSGVQGLADLKTLFSGAMPKMTPRSDLSQLYRILEFMSKSSVHAARALDVLQGALKEQQ